MQKLQGWQTNEGKNNRQGNRRPSVPTRCPNLWNTPRFPQGPSNALDDFLKVSLMWLVPFGVDLGVKSTAPLYIRFLSISATL